MADRGKLTEVCPTCGATDPDKCGLGTLEVGCDHPVIEREIADLLRTLQSGELIQAHKRLMKSAGRAPPDSGIKDPNQETKK